MVTTSASEIEESVKKAAKYIQERQTPDGGYFFACVPPGNLLDTFFAADSLRILGRKPRRRTSLEHFIASFHSDYANGSIHAIYLAIGTLTALGKPIKPFYAFGEMALSHFRLDELQRFERLDIEVVSELKQVFESVNVFTRLQLQFDKESVADLILSLFNEDGGFGRNKRSTIATSYYAVQTLALMNYPLKTSALTMEFLQKKEKEIYYIEDLFYLMQTRSTLGDRPRPPQSASIYLDI
jgi:hypothetical protein